MFHRMIVPFDGSARASEAAAMASHLASRTGASLELVYVESSEPTMLSEQDEEAVDRQMSTEVTRMRACGLDAHTHIEFGHVNETIIAACKELRADLMVFAPHHRNRLSRVLPTGMTEHLLVRAPVPLLVCPEQGQDHPPHALELLSGRDGLVICPLDGSDVAERALHYAIRLARAFERTLLLIRVMPLSLCVASSPQAQELLREAKREDEHRALHYLRAIRHRLVDEQDMAEVCVETMLLSGDAAQEILDLSVAHDASVLVMSTHGRSGLSRMMIGSVTSEVLYRTRVPLFVVPAALVLADMPHMAMAARDEVHAVQATEHRTAST